MAASVPFKAVIMGAPASGKGTIASRILKNFNLGYISSGDSLRRQIQQNTPIGVEAQKYINQGKLVPDELMIKFIADEINKLNAEAWLIDGFPRTLSQAQALWKVQKLDLAVNLVVPFDVIIDRTKGRLVHLPSGRVYNQGYNDPKVPGKDDITGEPLIQRDDDKPEVVKKRLEQYQQLTAPVVGFFKDKGILKEFHGKTSDEIWKQVLDMLIRYLPVHIKSKN